MNARDVLIEARGIIENPVNWCNGPPRAEKHCAITAIYVVCNDCKVRGEAADALERQTLGLSIPRYNDTHTHGEVLAAFDRAIAGWRSLPAVLTDLLYSRRGTNAIRCKRTSVPTLR